MTGIVSLQKNWVRTAFVTNVIPDYRYPVFKKLLDEACDDLRIFVSQPTARSCALAKQHLPLRFSSGLNLSWTTKHSRSGAHQREPLPIPILLFVDLLRFQPQVIVSGEFGARSLVCWAVARLVGAKFVLWSEDIAASAVGRSKLQHMLRQFLVSSADRFLAWGKPAAEYLRGFGIEQDQIFNCAQAIDNELWMRRAEALDRVRLRNDMQLRGAVFLLVGRLLPRKGFANFLQAWTQLPAELHDNITAILVGEGPQREELLQLAARHGLNNVRLIGVKSPEQLATYYAVADAFVLPSLEDVWGLVVNEALCFGLPVLASKFAGAAQELVHGRGTGEIFDPTDVKQFCRLLGAWARSMPQRNMQQAHAVVGALNFDCSVSAIQRALTDGTQD